MAVVFCFVLFFERCSSRTVTVHNDAHAHNLIYACSLFYNIPVCRQRVTFEYIPV